MKKIFVLIIAFAMFVSCQSPMLSTSKVKTDKSYTYHLIDVEYEVNTDDQE